MNSRMRTKAVILLTTLPYLGVDSLGLNSLFVSWRSLGAGSEAAEMGR